MEGILTTGAAEILTKLVFSVSEEIGLAWGIKDELKKLQRTLELILLVIADAEKKQVTDAAVKLWLRRLKDVAYDADDVMDEYFYETMLRSERDRLKYKVRDFVSSSNPLVFRTKMAAKVKDIRKRLDEVTNDMSRFQLQMTPSSTVSHGQSGERLGRQTASVVSQSEIVGREDDRNNIIKLLTEEASSSVGNSNQYPENVSVISIVGMGGLGKTTLAQLVYNDELVKGHFEPKIWVCVSEDFDVSRLLLNIMESITSSKFSELSSFDVLVHKVREQLMGKKYLLVLDDLWNEDAEQWERLHSLLVVGEQGSKILITTRKNQVADVVKGSIPPYKLKHLDVDDCWSIIERRAFSPGGALKSVNMTNIGKEITSKCSGLPLAAKFLGSLMHSKSKVTDWLSIRDADIWKTPGNQSKILPILRLSYDNLSSPLKQCFAYCSIFPKGWEINKESLIQLWMAEGFLEPADVNDKRSVEDIGDEYFGSLVWSSFLEGLQMTDLRDTKTCMLHDLVLDLAQAVMGDHECATVKVSGLANVSEVRHLELVMDKELSTTFPETFRKLKKLRTIIVLKACYSFNLDRFACSKHLRVLHLGHAGVECSEILLPISKFRHLRYLNLFSIDFSKPSKDESISRLFNLQTLVLSKCVHVENMLRDTASLRNLRHLDISFTDIKELPDSVTSLCNLQRLDLSNCQNFSTFPACVTGMKYLKFLDLSSTSIEQLPDFIISLCDLQTLDVSSCIKLRALPKSVIGLVKLRIFSFQKCPLIEELPKDFGKLTQLRSVHLFGTDIKVLPEPDAWANLYNLEYLHLFKCELPKDIKNLRNLRVLMYHTEGTPMGIGELIYLQTLTYKVPEKVLNNPEVMGIEELRNLNFLEHLFIYQLQNVKASIDAERANLKEKRSLRFVILHWCENASDTDNHSAVLEALQPYTKSMLDLEMRNFMGLDLPTWMLVPSRLPYLKEVKLLNCKGIKQLPAAFGQLPNLQILHLIGMTLKSLDIEFSSLTELSLTDMFLLEEVSNSYPRLVNLNITGCKSLIQIPSFPLRTKMVLEKINHRLVSSIGRRQNFVTSFHLHNVEELVVFPVGILQNNCLVYLEIKECNQFEGFQAENKVALPGPDIHMSAMQTLILIDCPVLKVLPDLRRWASLHLLLILRCPQVKQCLTYDLKSISSIGKLFVDFI